MCLHSSATGLKLRVAKLFIPQSLGILGRDYLEVICPTARSGKIGRHVSEVVVRFTSPYYGYCLCIEIPEAEDTRVPPPAMI